jgi:hypothetical protein
VKYAIRIPANESLERDVVELRLRPGGASQSQTDRLVQELSLQGRQWDGGAASGGEGSQPLSD